MYEPTIQNLRDFKLPARFRGRSAFVVQLWWIVASLFFATSPQFMYGWRIFLLRLFGAKIGIGVKIRPGARVTYPWRLTVGNYCWIGDRAEFYNLGHITLGNHVSISQDVSLVSGSHDFRAPLFDIFAEPITIEDECWLCAGVFVHQGVTVARGSVVSARSTVKESTEPFSINAGIPSRRVGYRKRTESESRHLMRDSSRGGKRGQNVSDRPQTPSVPK